MANEKRLIDANAFIKECDRLLKNPPFAHPATPWDRGLLLAAETALRLLPVDAVEVVRCKDCRHSEPCGESRQCLHPYGLNTCDGKDFCSYGEKREV